MNLEARNIKMHIEVKKKNPLWCRGNEVTKVILMDKIRVGRIWETMGSDTRVPLAK